MSYWNNTLLSAGIGWNVRSVSLLLGHIQPVATENTSCEAALCCEEIVLPVAVGFGLTSLHLPIKSSLQTPSTHCSITHYGIPVVVVLDSVSWWALPKHLERRGREKEKRINSYLYVAAAFCWQSASKDLLPCPLSPCQTVIEPS